MSVPSALAILQDVQQAWNAAMQDWNVEQLVDLFDENVQFFGSMPELFTGRDGVRSYFAKFPAAGCTADFRGDVAIHISEMVIGSGFITFNLSIDDEVRVLPFRYSFGLIERQEGWKILLHHTSPFTG
jgi:ketosteroid isomerase-like protein